MYTNSNEIGAIGERKVAEYLKSKGCIIIKRNWKDRYGEVDIIAQDSKNIIFVEVKTRSEDALFAGNEAIDVGKRKRIRNASLMFVKRLNTDLEPRIDTAEVTYYKKDDGTTGWKLNYIKSAF